MASNYPTRPRSIYFPRKMPTPNFSRPPTQPPWRRALRVLLILLVGYVLLALGMATFQDKLIYLPSRAAEATLLKVAPLQGMTPWRDRAGSVIGWKSANAKGAPNRLLVAHGNAGYALHRTYYVHGFGGLAGGSLWEVYVLEYPGYGGRSGSPGMESITAALRTAWETLHAEDTRPVYVLGESIGSGPACATTTFQPAPAGLCLVTPFFDLRTVAAHHFPWLPVKLLLRKQWNNTAALAQFSGPVAVVVAAEDEVIPVAEGQRLYESAQNPKRLWTMAGAGHNTIDYTPNAPLWRELSDFLLTSGQSPQ